MNPPMISIEQVQAFFLVFVRMGGLMLSMPLLDSRNIPLLFKVGLGLAVSVIVFPLLPEPDAAIDGSTFGLAIAIAGELMLGAAIGLAVRLVMAGIQLAGEVTGVQMGLSLASVIDPEGGAQVPLVAQFYYLFAMLLFLVLNAHHGVLRALVESFRLVPLGGFSPGPSAAAQFMALAGNLFVVAVRIGAPVMTALLLTSAALGLVARTVPQMNIFIVAMPIKIVIGLIFTAVSLPVMAAVFKALWETLYRDIFRLITP